MPCVYKSMHMQMHRKKTMIVLVLAAMVIFCLLTSACVSAPTTQDVKKELPQVPSITPPGITPLPTLETPAADNSSTIPPPAHIICNCPMEPVVSVTLTPTTTPDDGLCHCP